MPYKWIPPKQFMKIDGKRIYHCYKDDEAERIMDYWYTTDEIELDDALKFDVRDVAGQLENRGYIVDCDFLNPKDVRDLLRAAAKMNVLKFPEER